jgi:hypothetical protein
LSELSSFNLMQFARETFGVLDVKRKQVQESVLQAIVKLDVIADFNVVIRRLLQLKHLLLKYGDGCLQLLVHWNQVKVFILDF